MIRRPDLSKMREARERVIPLAEQERRWLEANKTAIDAYNHRVARDGLLADEAGLL
jgi:post-segregation antitoxin (ccd killing protein)